MGTNRFALELWNRPDLELSTGDPRSCHIATEGGWT